MKTFFTLLLATIFTTSAFAYDEGRLTITVAANKNVQLYIDNQLYQDNDNSFVLNNVQPGNHTIRIYSNRGNSNGRNNRNNRKNNNDLIYSSTIYVKPSYHVDVMINRFGKALVDERSLNEGNNRWDEDLNNGGYNNGGYDNGGYNNSRYQPMNNADFQQLISKIKSQWFASGKMNTAKDAVQRNYFSTAQVREILQLFSSDNDKLEVGKLAYRNTVDQKNYYSLYDVFAFQSSRDELDRYIRDARY